MIDRMQLIKEELLREYIRKQLRNQDQLIENKENALRNIIRGMLDEGVDKEGTTENTGINALEKLLSGNVLTIFKDTYKELTTDPAQRVSYIKHMLSFIDDTLKPDQINDEAAEEASPGEGTEDLEEKVLKRGDKYVYVDKKGKVRGTHDTKQAAEKQAKAIFISRNVGEGLEEVKVSVGDEISDEDALFPDIDDPQKNDEADDFVLTSLEGLDQTGREFAIKAFDGGMNTQITKAYSMLRGKDAELFKKYLLKNLDLHRMQAEKELPEPNDDLANLPVEDLK
tara:strand:+ start:535 stop:1383 length:849 start_codon:yes stop_codon:yes gene_type:complete